IPYKINDDEDGFEFVEDPDRRMDRSAAMKALYDNYSRDRNSELDRQFIKDQAAGELYDSNKKFNTLAEIYSPTQTTENLNLFGKADAPKKPDKIVHENKLPNIIIPKQKDDGGYDNNVVGGILNASSFAFNSEKSSKVNNFYSMSDDDSNVDGFRSMLSGDVSSFETSISDPEPAPIINADYFAKMFKVEKKEEPKEESKEVEPNFGVASSSKIIKSPADMHVGSFTDFSSATLPDEKKTEAPKVEDKEAPRAPIINSSFAKSIFAETEKEEAPAQHSPEISPIEEESVPESVDKITDDSFNEFNNIISEFSPETDNVVEDDEAIYETEQLDEIEETFASFAESETKEITDTVEEPKTEEKPFVTSSFVVEEEPVDMSEHKTDFTGENSGYYVEQTEKPKREKKSKVLPGQMEMDTSVNTEGAIVAIPQAVEPYDYTYPPATLLSYTDATVNIDMEDIERKSRLIEQTLNDLKFKANVVNVVSGPTVTRFELQPQPGMQVRKILGFSADLEYALASGNIRIEAPVANKQAVGIEVANNSPAIVGFREIIEANAFTNTKYVLPLAVGKDIGGEAIVRSLEKMPHLLVAGTTGTGKSVCLNTLIMSLIYKRSPEDVRIILVDPKQVEFTLYHEMPHLLLRKPITDADHAINALDYLIEEMNRRYDIFNNLAMKGYPVRNLEEYNNCSLVKERKAMKLPYIVMIVDELADLMSTRKKDVENRIRTITQKSRASGIHLVLATQRPSVDVITGTIKVNLPARMAFKVTSRADSTTILDHMGAETLLGRGDMLLMDNAEPFRLQGAFISNEEIVSVVDFIKKNNKTLFDEEIENKILASKEQASEISATSSDEENADEKLFPDIMRCLITSGTASTSLIQRRFSFGYSRASRIIDIFEQRKWVGPRDGAKPREVYMTETQFEECFNEPFNE
ncbi:MAG: DNA translocase FtsK, partial [Clostridia bacterium]|nr:DNA translocase FtsK [Clostridia bacterium]